MPGTAWVDALDGADVSSLRVSVVVPAFRDDGALRDCLDALRQQDVPRSWYELVVVNNAPEPIAEDIADKADAVLHESRPGSYAARNCGIQHARAPILAFTDADCRPREDWLRNAVAAIEAGNPRVAGRIELTYQGDRLTWAEIYEKACAFDQEGYAAGGAAATANMVAERSCFDRAGLFDASLMSGGDMEWGWRAASHGIPIAYAAEVVVRHPARHEIRQLLGKARRVARGTARLQASGKDVRGRGWVRQGLRSALEQWRRIGGNPVLTRRERAIAGAMLVLLRGVQLGAKVAARLGFDDGARAPRDAR